MLLSYPIISVCGRLSPYDFEMLSISPQQAYSFRCWFCQQLHSILTSKFFSFNSFNSSGGIALFISSSASHWVKLVFYSFHLQPECCLNPFSLIRFLSRSNRSGFIVYLIPWAFDSRHSHRSSLLLECSRFFSSSLEFLLHLFLFSSVSVLRSRDEISC